MEYLLQLKIVLMQLSDVFELWVLITLQVYNLLRKREKVYPPLLGWATRDLRANKWKRFDISYWEFLQLHLQLHSPILVIKLISARQAVGSKIESRNLSRNPEPREGWNIRWAYTGWIIQRNVDI